MISEVDIRDWEDLTKYSQENWPDLYDHDAVASFLIEYSEMVDKIRKRQMPRVAALLKKE